MFLRNYWYVAASDTEIGRAPLSREERERLALPADGDMISVDRRLVRAIKDML